MTSKCSQARYEIIREILSSKLCEILDNSIKTLEKQTNKLNIYSEVGLKIIVSSPMGTIMNILSLTSHKVF